MGAPEVPAVSLTVGADPRNLRTVRMVAASFAADLGFSLDDIGDVRLAVDEAVNVLIAVSPPASRIVLDFEAPATPGGATRLLRITGCRREPARRAYATDEYDTAVEILRAATDRCSLDGQGFSFEKVSRKYRRPALPPAGLNTSPGAFN